MAGDFPKVDAVEVKTSLGPASLPVLYADSTAVLAFFWVEPERARRALEGTGLAPLGFPGQRALLGLAFFDHRDTSIGAYHEVGSALAVMPASAQPSRLGPLELFRPGTRCRAGFRLLDLPVSTAFADTGGRELWGFPKFLAELPIRSQAGTFQGQVLEPGGTEPLLTLSGAVRWRCPGPSLDLVFYSHLGERMLRTVMEVRGAFRYSGGRGLSLALGARCHRMVETLGDLGLDGAHPFATGCCHQLRARLHAGVPA